MAHQNKFFYQTVFSKEFIALIDSSADINCIHKGLIPVRYFEQTLQTVVGANKQPLQINYKISNVHVCNKNTCYKISLLLVKNMNKEIILGTSFFSLLYPFRVNAK